MTAKQIAGYLKAAREPFGISHNDAYNRPTYGITKAEYDAINRAMHAAYGMFQERTPAGVRKALAQQSGRGHATKKAGLSAEQRDEIRAALAGYGGELTEDDRIAKGGKVMSVRLDVKGGRLRALGGDNVLASYPASRAGQGVSDFVEKFWFWKKAVSPAGPSHGHARKKSPTQLDREIVEALAAPTTEAARLGLRWLHVKMKHKGRELLGTIKDVRRDQAGKLHLIVHHFNGEPWPLEPAASKVQIV